ncbi:hypothetical protein LSCM1_07259 [Leishmania martiniquensis]|uniref:Uncharacterized protein n=1 Tax=Leishmania martiniquensis TaxID=1580590 RepID=A0A836H7C3_9TRYP|nr:hypothetical protein LSCM1_07259 [Leishmania martiniquensis]
MRKHGGHTEACRYAVMKALAITCALDSIARCTTSEQVSRQGEPEGPLRRALTFLRKNEDMMLLM